MITNFVVDAPVTIPITNGFLVMLRPTSPILAVPGGGGTGRTKANYMPSLLTVRGTKDVPLLNMDFMDIGIPYYSNVSLPYFGDLEFVNVPFGSTWTVDVSDTFIPYTP